MTEDWERTIGLADAHGTVARVAFDEDEDGAIASVSLRSGAAAILACPTPEALRQLAAAMLDAADAMQRSEEG